MDVRREDNLRESRILSHKMGERFVEDGDYLAKKKTVNHIIEGLWVVVWAVAVVIFLRMAFIALLPEVSNDLLTIFYNVTEVMVAPFANLFTNPVAADGRLFELTSAVAIVVYVLIGWLILATLRRILMRAFVR